MNMSNPVFFIFWGLLSLVVLLLIVRRIVNWRKQVMLERAEREAEYVAAVDSVDSPGGGTGLTSVYPDAPKVAPAHATVSHSPNAVAPPVSILKQPTSPVTGEEVSVHPNAIHPDKYNVWSPQEVTTWQPPADQVYNVSWSGRQLFHSSEKNFEEPNYIPKIGPDALASVNSDDLAFGPATLAMASLMPMTDEERVERELKQAGYYKPHAKQNLQATRFMMVILTIFFIGGLLLLVPAQPGGKPSSTQLGLLVSLIGGPILMWAVPRVVIQNKAAERKSELERSMPDMLDMLNMCVSQGLTIPTSLKRIAIDLKPVYPTLASELAIVAHQSEVGNMQVALDNFADRVDVPEVDSFVSLMNQSEKMGTNVSDALTEYSNTMRESLRQRTDEKANKASFKLMFPTVLFMMPAVFMFLMGPAILELQEFFDQGGLDTVRGATQLGDIGTITQGSPQ
jgi:tight adherence protein C